MKDEDATPFLSAGFPVDKGPAWFTLACTFVVIALSVGNLRSYSVIHAELMINSVDDSSGVFGVQGVGVSFLLAIVPVAMALTKRFNARVALVIGAAMAAFGNISSAFVVTVGRHWLYLTISVFLGSGAGMCISISSLVVTQYFARHLVLACGIMLTGLSTGALLWPYVLRFLLDAYAIPGTFVMSGAITLHCIPVALLVRPIELYVGLGHEMYASRNEEYGSFDKSKNLYSYTSTEVVEAITTATNDPAKNGNDTNEDINFNIERNQEKYTTKFCKFLRGCLTKIMAIAESSIKSCLFIRYPTLLIFAVCFALLEASIAASLVVLPAFAVEINVSKLNISTLMSVAGLSEVFGRLIISGITDLRIFQGKCGELYVVNTMLFGISAIICSCIPSQTSLAIFSVFFGVFCVSSIAFVYVLLDFTFGKPLYPDALSHVSIVMLFGPVLSVFTCQYIGEVTRSWAWPMRCCGIFSVLSACGVSYKILIGIYRKR